MLFSILIWSIPLLILGLPLTTLFLYRKCFHPYEEAFVSFVVGIALALTPTLFVVLSWDGHADDLAVIGYQDKVIRVHYEEVSGLVSQLESFEYERGTLLNADSPVASAVASLSEARKRLADAREKKADAVVRIEARRKGTMSNVIHWVGDYR